jgi:hypothetical protein
VSHALIVVHFDTAFFTLTSALDPSGIEAIGIALFCFVHEKRQPGVTTQAAFRLKR